MTTFLIKCAGCGTRYLVSKGHICPLATPKEGKDNDAQM